MNSTALIVVDMVYDFVNPNGLVFYPQNLEVLPSINNAIDACRKSSCLIVFIQHCYRKDKYDKNLLNMRANCIEGSGGEELDSSLHREEKDYVIKKRRYSGFFGTDLDLILRENGIKNVIVVGTKTNCCIRATVTDAYYLDYNVIVISQCVATNDKVTNDVHLMDIDKYFGKVITLVEFEKNLKEGKL